MFGRMEDPTIEAQHTILNARAKQLAARIADDEVTEILATIRLDQALDRWEQLTRHRGTTPTR